MKKIILTALVISIYSAAMAQMPGMKMPMEKKENRKPVPKKEQEMGIKKDTVPTKKEMKNMDMKDMKMKMDTPMKMENKNEEKNREIEKPKAFFQKEKTERYDFI